MVVIAGAAALGMLCVDGVFGDKRPGAHHCGYCGDWLCPKHYADHINAGEHSYHHDESACGDSGKLTTGDATGTVSASYLS